MLCRGPILLLHFCPGPFLGMKLHGSYASGECHLTCQLDPSACFQKLCFAPTPTCPLGSYHTSPRCSMGMQAGRCGDPGSLLLPPDPQPGAAIHRGLLPSALCPPEGHGDKEEPPWGLYHVQPWGLFLVLQGGENLFQVLRLLLRKLKDEVCAHPADQGWEVGDWCSAGRGVLPG